MSSTADALHAAVATGDVAEIARALDAGADLEARDPAGRTPLLVAVEADRIDAVRLLLERGADINAQADNKDTPWLQAGALGRAEMIRLMIPIGPDFSVRNRFGGNALIPACERGHVEAIEVLLTSGIDVDHVNDLGWTCLLEIVILGDGGSRHQEAARLVLAAGADPNLADGNGVRPLAHAEERGQVEVSRIIREAGGRQ